MLDPLENQSLSRSRDTRRAQRGSLAPTTQKQKALWKACQEFESVLMGQMLKQMRTAVQTTDPLNQGMANDTWRDMLDDERARAMAQAGGIGLADQMYRQLVNNVSATETAKRNPE